MRLVLALSIISFLIMGCGNKGPLVLPTKPNPAPPAAAKTPTDDNSKTGEVRP